MTEEVMQGYIDAYVRFKEEYKLSDWWLVSLPSFIVALGLKLSVGSPMWLVFAVLSYIVVGYQAKLQLKLYKDTKLPEFTEELKGVDYMRDGWSSYLSTICYIVSVYVYSILGFTTLVMLSEISVGLVVLFTTLFLAGLIILPYFTHIPFTLVPYILATNDEIGPLEAVKLSYKLMRGDSESKMQIVHAYLLTIVLVVISAFLLFIPLVFIFPYLNYYLTDVYATILKKHKLYDIDSDGLNAQVKVTATNSELQSNNTDEDELQTDGDELTVQDLVDEDLTDFEIDTPDITTDEE